MKAQTLVLASLATALVACGESKPPSQLTNVDVMPVDGLVVDSVAMPDGGDVPVVPTDGDATADGDSGGDADDATPDGAMTDAPTDRPLVAPGLCMWSHNDLTNFAIRMGLCTLSSPQDALNTYFRPDNWEGGALSLRACPALLCVATTISGTCGDWLSSCVKYTVARAAGGTCPPPASSCESMPARFARTCTDGVEIRDDCGAVGRRCLSSSTEAACVSTTGEACTPGSPARCTGNVLEHCVIGVYTPVRNCTLTSGLCDAATDTCRGAGPECTGDAIACDGSLLRVCRGGHWHSIDCGRLVTGASCQTVAGHSFCGVSNECDPTTAARFGSCDANTLVLCAAGRTYRYVCEPRNGFIRCDASIGCVP